MELPARRGADRFAPSGEFNRLCGRLRETGSSEIPTLIVNAFDSRTRMLPFILWDRQIVPAGIRGVSAAMAHAGFTRQRVVSQSWTPNIRPSMARIDGASPELLLVSSMQIHSAEAYQLIRDAHRMGEDRPLIIAGGPKAIYQPWDFFGFDQAGRSADVVCTGEEFVLIELLDRLADCKLAGESYRDAFERARRNGWLDDIPGLLYDCSPDPEDRSLVDTGVQRLVQDLEELPLAVEGYRFLERPHRGRFLDRHPIAAREIRRFSRVASLVTTRGCKFRCSYCPIPAYNQYSFRNRSPESLVRDIAGIRRQLGIHLFFGTDDNFFNDETVVEETFEALARAGFEKDDIGKAARFGTEGTEADVYKQRDLLPLCYRGGLRAIWFGIEDMTATLVKKGQSVSKTVEVFQVLRQNRILPMAMMMHFDGQPLRTGRDSMVGLLNQVRFLFENGAASLQVTVLGPAAGTKDYDDVLQSGIILKDLAGVDVEDRYWDGNHVISVGSGNQPWRTQINVLIAYALFYNPLKLGRVLFGKGRKWSDCFLQLWGMWGLAITAWRLVPWVFRLRGVKRGNYRVRRDIPRSRWPIVSPDPEALKERTASPYLKQTIGASDQAERKRIRDAVLSKY